jgi:conjugal transfer pilus assembly protein TraV
MRMNFYKKQKRLTQLVLATVLVLPGCSSASESFDSEATKGVGSKSISEVNAMIDQGKIDGIRGDGDANKVIAPVLVQSPLPALNQETIVLSDHSVIHRQPEQHMRIWMAPFQDANGNFHEAAVVHTLQRPSFWQVNTVG